MSGVRLLDRYMLKNFLLPFVYCVIGFLGVWLVFELSSHANEFVNSGIHLKGILAFYGGQLPSIALIILPIALLLALLFCLGRMSTSNELLAMLSTGVSLGRVLMPIFGVGLAVTAFSTYLSYALAPQADAQRELAEAQMEAGNKLERMKYSLGYLFRNRRENRLWYVEKLYTDLKLPLDNVQVVQQDANDNISDKLYAKQGTYDAAHSAWVFTDCKLVHFLPNGDVDPGTITYPSRHVVTGWSETPWRLASAMLESDRLSVPELRQYLQLNSDFTSPQLAPFRTYLFVRWALPWMCMVVVLIAAPLGIVYQRRSVIVGVAASIILFLCFLFSDNLFHALGRGDRGVGPFWAAWATNLIFALIGAVLLRVRALNRDRLPLTPARFWDFLTA